ncbi:MAG TPA: pyridoxal phosphate-dependent aminotransferase [bacterium]|nr:pyridoxal phosphate-dependent aminotransferase [bacterium]
MDIAERMKQISPSMTLAIDAKAKKLKDEGQDILNFGVGEPDFNTPAVICEAAKKAIDEGHHKYTPAAGTLELRKAIGQYLDREYKVHYEPGDIVVSGGGKHSLYNTFLALVNPGDEVLIPSPYWVSYPEQVKFAGGAPVYVECSEADEFKLTPAAVKAKITPKTKVLILNSPSNPTGAVVNRKAMEGIAELALKHHFWVVSDEIYAKMVYGEEHVCFPSLSKEVAAQTILINGMSKAYAMTGWRIGYAAGPSKVMKVIADFQSHSTSNPTAISQKASVAGLAMPDSEVQKMVEVFRKRRDIIVDGLNSIPGVRCLKPAGAFYVFPNVKGLLKPGRSTSMELSEYLLEKAKVAVTPGIAFGAEGYMRFSYAVGEKTIQEALRRIKEVV